MANNVDPFKHLLNSKDEFSVHRKEQIEKMEELLKDTNAKVDVCNVVFFDESNITLQALQNLKYMGTTITPRDLDYKSYKALEAAHVAIFSPTKQVLKNRFA